MRTVTEIQVSPQGTLWVDVLLDPPALAIRRQGGGLVRVERDEVGDLLTTLALAALDVAALEAETRDNERQA